MQMPESRATWRKRIKGMRLHQTGEHSCDDQQAAESGPLKVTTKISAHQLF